MRGTEQHISEVMQAGLDPRRDDGRRSRRARVGSAHPPAPRCGAGNRSAIYIAAHEGALL
jgi:hypothetical protein